MTENAVLKIPAYKARQGRRGTQVLVILVTALVLAGAVWLGLEFYGEAIDSREGSYNGTGVAGSSITRSVE